MDNRDVFSHVDLVQDDVVLLKSIIGNLGILADLCRADLLLYARMGPEHATAIAQARPHSFTPLYEDDRVGRKVSAAEQPEVIRALAGKVSPDTIHTISVRGATVARQVYPVRNEQGRLIAAMAEDAYWLAHERQRRRSRVFQDALIAFIGTVLRGDLCDTGAMSPFGEHDGIMYVNSERRVQYMSGIASELFRHLGYRDSLVGRRVSDLDTIDQQMVTRTINERLCLEQESEQDGLTWIRKSLPVTMVGERPWEAMARRFGLGDRPTTRVRGAFILIHDVTETLRTQRELESKMAMIREVHHRVKNNLQVIASLMRMQARRVQSAEARTVLEESVNRVLSVAVVHEFLSQNAKGTINLREIAHRIMGQVKQGLLDPGKRIELSVKGPDVWLPAEGATRCALIVNELVQNSIEHGMVAQDEGWIQVELQDYGERVGITVSDNGEGLPDGFSLDANANLGLRIVRSMVERDLRGEFGLSSANGVTRAEMSFGKSVLGGGG